jgi:hypothetical protein
LNLIDRGWALGAIATATARVPGIALKSPDLTRLFVDKAQQTAG